MRSRHGSKLGTWPCVRRYRRRGRFRLNSTAESGITILPPPPFQKEDPWTITKERESWAGTRNPPEKKKFTLGPSKLQNAPLIRRILGAPLESNPVSSPPSITSPLHPKSPTGTGAAVTPSHDPDLLSPRDNHRLTISTRSSQAIPEDEQPEISDTRSVRSNFRPQNARRLPGVSYFSWTMSSPTTTAPNKHQSFMSKSAASNKRETMTTVDSEPPRFRTITSWVNQQRKRTNGISDAPPVPSKDNSFNPPLTPRVADSPLKQSMGQSSDTPTKPPLLLSKPTPPHPPIRAAPLPASIPDASPARENQEHIPPVPPLPSANFVPPPPPTPLKPRADNKYHSRTVSVSTNDTTTPPASMHKKNASSTASSLPTVFKHHPGDKVEITRI
ncbi:hypothetical protein FQN54_006633 [Arachnomyces sp. PD_36]|nr:hypothetical protein FQN54_006633 [Arachnomyces sp. PD_36]